MPSCKSLTIVDREAIRELVAEGRRGDGIALAALEVCLTIHKQFGRVFRPTCDVEATAAREKIGPRFRLIGSIMKGKYLFGRTRVWRTPTCSPYCSGPTRSGLKCRKGWRILRSECALDQPCSSP